MTYSTRFSDTVRELVSGLQTGDVVLTNEEDDWEQFRNALPMLMELQQVFNEVIATSPLRGRELTNQLSSTVLIASGRILDFVWANSPVQMSYWLSDRNDAEMPLVAGFFTQHADRPAFGHVRFEKLPAEGSICGRVIQKKEYLFAGSLQQLQRVTDEPFYSEIAREIRSVAAWPLFIHENASRVPVAVLLLEGSEAAMFRETAPIRAIVQFIANILEFAFELGVRDDRQKPSETADVRDDSSNTR